VSNIANGKRTGTSTNCAGQELTLRSGGRDCLAVTVGSSCGQQINDVFDRLVGAMVGGLEAAVVSVLRIGSMVGSGAVIKMRVRS
jgi:hypothetical protein